MRVLGFIDAPARVVSVILTVSVALLSVGVTQSTAAGDDSAAARVSLAPQEPLVLGTEESVTFDLGIANDSDSSLEVGSIAFFVDRNRVLSPEELEARLEVSELPAGIGVAVGSLPQSSVDAGDESTQTIDVPVAALQLPASGAAGVYLVFARVTSEQGVFVSAAPFVWQGTGVLEQTPLHTVVPLMLPPEIDGMPTLNQLGELTQSNGRLANTAASAIALGSTLAIDPRLVAATDTFGERAPTSATTFLEQLQTPGLQTFALQFANADLSAQAQLALDKPLTPQGFGFMIDDPTAEPFSTFTFSLPGVAWPRENTVTDTVVDFIQRAEFSTVLLDSENVVLTGGSAGDIGPTKVVSLPAAVQQSTAAALLSDSAVARSAGSARMVALLALVNQTQDTAVPVNLGIDRGGAALRDASPVLETLAELPWLRSVGIDAVLAQANSATITDQPLPQERLDSLRAALDNEPRIDAYGAVLEEPLYLTQLQRMRVLEFFATSIGPGSPGFPEVTAAFVRRDEQTLQGVQITTSSTTNVVGTSTNLPIQVSNALPFTALITAETVASNSSLRVDEPLSAPTEISKNSSINLTVPVQARVSAGQSLLVVKIFAQDGQVIDEAILDVNIQSSWESLALGLLGILVGSFFGFGIWRSVKSRRQRSAAQASESIQN